MRTTDGLTTEFFTRTQFTVGVIGDTLRIWLGVVNLTAPIRRLRGSRRQWAMWWCSDHLSISLGGDMLTWDASDPWYWNIRIPVIDLMLGPQTERRVLEEVEDVLVPLPEGSYPAKAVRWTYTYRRPFWFTKHVTYTEIFLTGLGVPVPMPWGEDRDSGDLFTGDIDGALAQFITKILRHRRKRGGSPMWKPKDFRP